MLNILRPKIVKDEFEPKDETASYLEFEKEAKVNVDKILHFQKLDKDIGERYMRICQQTGRFDGEVNEYRKILAKADKYAERFKNA
jgi:hypothetical protein